MLLGQAVVRTREGGVYMVYYTTLAPKEKNDRKLAPPERWEEEVGGGPLLYKNCPPDAAIDPIAASGARLSGR